MAATLTLTRPPEAAGPVPQPVLDRITAELAATAEAHEIGRAHV